ncbi:MAG: hypothetical protein H6648_08865 [Caldilineae bacterium]|nr:hypothetical protein [Chloroflexota bacterium]MCB9177257.1 hypothetical protein [Caldilineae bacterium]
MTSPIESTPIAGDVRLTIAIDALQATANPERFGKAEYLLSMKVAGLERWQSERPFHVGEGGTVPIGVTFDVEVDAETKYLDIEVHAAEQDWLSPDDHARGHVRIYRSAGFDAARGFVVPIRGEGTEIELRCSVATLAR